MFNSFSGPGAPFPVNTFCRQSRKSVQLVPRNKFFFHPHIKSYKTLTEREGGGNQGRIQLKSLCHSGGVDKVRNFPHQRSLKNERRNTSHSLDQTPFYKGVRKRGNWFS